MFHMDKDNTRTMFGDIVFEMAREDDKIIAMSGDSVASMGFGGMQEAMPNRVINAGIAEQNAMNVAAGMAAAGLKPVIGGFAPFMTMRACEQVRTFVCYPNLNVTIAGGMSGLSANIEGVTHQGLEDVGIFRTFPNMVIAAPADAAAARVITKALIRHEGPAYVRLYKGPVFQVYENEDSYHFEIGKANLLKDGTDATIIVNGPVTYRALEVAETMGQAGVSVRVLEMPCIKPLDNEAVIQCAKETGCIVTLEDHQIIGGLGSAVAECLSENYPVVMKRLGVPDVFPESGNHYELMDKYGMSLEDIENAVKEVIAKK